MYNWRNRRQRTQAASTQHTHVARLVPAAMDDDDYSDYSLDEDLEDDNVEGMPNPADCKR